MAIFVNTYLCSLYPQLLLAIWKLNTNYILMLVTEFGVKVTDLIIFGSDVLCKQ